MKRWITLFAGVLLFAVLCLGQAKKAYTFHGKVEAVNQTGQTLNVQGEKVEGWMGAMTMDYKVDNPQIFKTVKPGDQITATVYAGDYTLHNVQVAPKTKKK